MGFVVIKDEPGPHAGWRDIFIDRDGDLYRLRQIDDGRKRQTIIGPAASALSDRGRG